MLKPGPKPGSVRKRQNADHGHLRDARKHRKRVGTAASQDNPDQIDSQGSPSNPVPGVLVSTEVVRQHSVNVYNLIVPSHEESSPESARLTASPERSWLEKGEILKPACSKLGLSPATVKQLVDIFFETFDVFGLFRRPTFFDKLSQISSSLQAAALLASILAFAYKHVPTENSSESTYCDLASEYVDKALAECGDDQPPLCLLQALILITHWRVIKGVRGRAWRSLGLCIRMAFELGVDSVDADRNPQSDPTDVAQWCEDEEQRRAYWAVYEMDIFATIMKQVRMTTDWGTKNVLLPVDDQKWFQGHPQSCCFLDPDLLQRTKALHEANIESARAWYILLNSLVAQSYVLSRSGSQRALSRRDQGRKSLSSGLDGGTNSRHACSLLLNSIQLYTLLLPARLKFRGQRLDFNDQMTNLTTTSSPQNGLIYQIAILTEVSRLLALRPYVFDTYVQSLLKTTDVPQDQAADETATRLDLPPRELQQCFNSSDDILRVVSNCSEFHYQYVNPYIAHAFWLAATVQLLQQELTEGEDEKKVIQSQFEILKATNDQFVRYWGVSAVPKQNLDELATRLKEFTAMSRFRSRNENQNLTIIRQKSPQGRDLEWPRGVGQIAGRPILDAAARSERPAPEKQTHIELRDMPNVDGTPPGPPTASNTDPLGLHYTSQQHSRIRLSQSLDTGPDMRTRSDVTTSHTTANHEVSLHTQAQRLPYSIAMPDEHDIWLNTASTSWPEEGQEEQGPCAVGNGVDPETRGWFPFINHDLDGSLSNYLDEIFSGFPTID